MSELIHNHLLSTETTILESVTDYIGFTFNGVHSSELGIVRTSEGSRFNESLLPAIQDKVVQVPGGDGAYYFGSNFTQKQFNISYAFEALTEVQLARIKKLFGDKKIHDLIFDEIPYKVYQAKVTGSASIKHIPFEEGVTGRVYKGEGSIQFTAYIPFARSVYKYADQYNVRNYIEWKDAANLLESQGDFDTLVGNTIKLYNPGDKETDFIITLNFDLNSIIPAGGIFLDADNQLYFNQIKSQNNDDQIKINTKTNLIEGYKAGKKSGKIYNRHITKGTFFKIPMTTEIDNPVILTIDNNNLLTAHFDNIEYDYLYF